MVLCRLPFTAEPGAKLPTRSYPDDAGFDLYVYEDVQIPVHAFRDVPTGLRMELPRGVWALITGRSSTIRSRDLLVVNGIIDTGWRGPLLSAVQNVGVHPVTLKAGERVAQMILFDALSTLYEPVEVQQLRPHEYGRDNQGFGSTGR